MNMHTTVSSELTIVPVPSDFQAHLPAMSIRELRLVYDILVRQADVLVSAHHDPLVRDRPNSVLNASLGQSHEDIHIQIDAVVHAIAERKPATSIEADHRGIVLIKHEIYCGGDLQSIAAIANEANSASRDNTP